MARCFALIEEEMIGRRGLINEPSIPRPSVYRRETKEQLRAQVRAEHTASIRAEAYDIYEKFTQGVAV